MLDHKGVITAAPKNVGCSRSNSERELLVAITKINRCAIQRTGDVDRILISTAVNRSVAQGADQEGVGTCTTTNASRPANTLAA